MLNRTEEAKLKLIAAHLATSLEWKVTDDDHLEDLYKYRLEIIWNELEALGGAALYEQIRKEAKIK